MRKQDGGKYVRGSSDKKKIADKTVVCCAVRKRFAHARKNKPLVEVLSTWAETDLQEGGLLWQRLRHGEERGVRVVALLPRGDGPVKGLGSRGNPAATAVNDKAE